MREIEREREIAREREIKRDKEKVKYREGDGEREVTERQRQITNSN